MLYAILAAAVAIGCVSATARKSWRLARRQRPSAAEVLEQIRAAKSGDRNADWLWELDELMIEVDGATRAPTELSQALSRASLASGTALAVLTLASAPDLAHLPEAGMSFGVGVVGAFAASYFGRLAKVYSASARSHWTQVARSVRAAIGEGTPGARPADGSVDGL